MTDTSTPVRACIPACLPPQVRLAFQQGIERTGWTPALEHAAQQLPRILAMPPDVFESTYAELYRRLV